MKLLAIDPGETTGLAWFEDLRLLRVWQVRLTLRAMFGLLRHLHPEFVVCEEFLVYPHVRALSWSRLFTVRLIGVVELYCELTQTPIVLQSASAAVQFIPAVNVSGDHGKSAVRHGLLFFYRKCGIAASICHTIAGTGLWSTHSSLPDGAVTVVAERDAASRGHRRSTVAPLAGGGSVVASPGGIATRSDAAADY